MALIRGDDWFRLIEKLRQGYFKRIIQSALPFANRTEMAWSHTEHPPKHWGSIPRIREHWNECISGSRQVTMQEYVAKRYPHLDGGRALSIGCGTGTNEILWARTGLFLSLEAFDLSDSRVHAARNQKEQVELSTDLTFSVASFSQIDEFGGGFDAIIAENALHHASDLSLVIEAIFRNLRPGGMLILRDFVGPSRFQWTKDQLTLTKQLLNDFPVELRTRWKTKSLKTRHYAPGTLSMIVSDPSEAAQSSRILSELVRHFEQIELKPLGGTLLQLIFDDLAHHFVEGGPDASQVVEQCIQQETKMIQEGQLPSDFVFGVFQRRG